MELKHYWICGDCALSKGAIWPEGHLATCHEGECKYCGTKNATLACISDWNWPRKETNRRLAPGRD